MKIPKRKKSKDNPYTIIYDNVNGKHKLKFKDAQKNIVIIEITDEIYRAFDSFELEDISQMHKYDKYIEHSEIYESTLYKKSINELIKIDEIVEKDIYNRELMNAIKKLSIIQRKRIIMYYFEEYTLEQIAKKEKCSVQAISKSIMNGLKNLKKILEKS